MAVLPANSFRQLFHLKGVEVIYGQRDELLEAESIKDNIDGIRADVVAEMVERFVPADSIDEQWDLPALEAELAAEFGIHVALVQLHKEQAELDASEIQQRVQDEVARLFEGKEAQVGGETMRMLEKHVMLNVLDQNWKEHLARMDYLRQGIHLRGYAQKQPKQEYKKEAFELFSELLEKVKREVVGLLARIRIRDEAVEWLLHKTLSDRSYGARPLRRAIQRHIEDALSEAFIRGQVRPGRPIEVGVEGGALVYEQDGRGGALSA